MSKKPLKPEGNGEVVKQSVKAERLASLFSSSRDLSLLNSKTNQRAQTNKRNHAPNLNVTRNKNSEKPSGDDNSRRDTRSDRGRNQKGRGGKNNNANNFNKKGNLIQTVGFLSEGIAAAPVNRRTGDSYGASSRESNVVDVLQKPRIIKRDTKPDKSDLDAEQKTLIDLLGEDGDDELNLDDDDSKTSSSDDFLPIKIRDPSKRSLVESNSKKLETDIKIKIEPVDDDDVVMESPDNSQLNGATTIKTEPGLEVKSEAFHRMDKLFDALPSEFMLFQLPDTLPGRAPEPTEPSSKPNLCSLEHLEEGPIGKLVRYKSGRTKLVIGDTVYDVDLGLTSDFQQHAATINANAAERSANVYSLGQINAKYNVTPDWVHLFHKMTP